MNHRCEFCPRNTSRSSPSSLWWPGVLAAGCRIETYATSGQATHFFTVSSFLLLPLLNPLKPMLWCSTTWYKYLGASRSSRSCARVPPMPSLSCGSQKAK